MKKKTMLTILLISFTVVFVSFSDVRAIILHNQPQKPDDSAAAVQPALASVVVPSSNVQGYKTYKNYRFGYSIDYPNNFTRTMSAANGDGIGLTSPDQQATLKVYGGNHAKMNIKEDYDLAVKSVKGELGYSVLESSWYVVTWKENGKINYRKEFVGASSHNGFTFSYPEDQKEQYDDIVKKAEASFQCGDTSKAW